MECLISRRRHFLVLHLGFWGRVFLLPSFTFFFLLGATFWWFPPLILLYVDLNYNISFHIFQAETHTWLDVVLQTVQLKHWCLVLNVSAELWFSALWLEEDLHHTATFPTPCRLQCSVHTPQITSLPTQWWTFRNLPCLSASRLLVQAVCVCIARAQ